MIRADADLECSIRELPDRYHVHRQWARQALTSAVRPPCKTSALTWPRLAPFHAVIDGMRSDLDAPNNSVIPAQLVDERGAGDMSYSTARDYGAARRRRGR